MPHGQAQEPNEGTAELSMGLWSGKLKHRMATAGGYSTVDLLNLTALIPDRCSRLPGSETKGSSSGHPSHVMAACSRVSLAVQSGLLQHDELK